MKFLNMKTLCKWTFVFAVLASPAYGYSKQNCVIEDNVMNCTCTERNNMTIQTIFDHPLEGIEIRHCGDVTLQMPSFAGLNLQYLVLDDLLTLDIKSLAFIAIQSLEYLQISNIQLLKNDMHSLHLTNVSKVIIQNVHAENLKRDFLAIDAVTHFVMTGCHFLNVDSKAVSLDNAQFVFIMNTSLDTIQSDAFHLNGTTHQLYFQNTSFKFTERGSFYIQDLAHLTFQNCSFGLIQTRFVGGHVTNFAFFNNQVNTVEDEAFSELNVTHFYWFANNRFQQAEEGFLLLPSYPTSNVTFKNNTFVCDCQLSWMWSSDFRNKSYCEDEYGEIYPMSELKVMKKAGICTDIVLATLNETTIEATEYSSQSVRSGEFMSGTSCLHSVTTNVLWIVMAVLFTTIFK